jgi:hypothetical protein
MATEWQQTGNILVARSFSRRFTQMKSIRAKHNKHRSVAPGFIGLEAGSANVFQKNLR